MYGMGENVSSLKSRVKHEMLELLPPTIFFLIAFHIITISRALMLRQYGVNASAAAGATIGALLVAKVVLLADMLPVGRSERRARRGVDAAGAAWATLHPAPAAPRAAGHRP
jgi:hypothetical protein